VACIWHWCLPEAILGFVLFLIVIGLARIIFYLTFPTLYKYIDQDLKKTTNGNGYNQENVPGWISLALCLFLSFSTLVANL
jgi:hypothetical protein